MTQDLCDKLWERTKNTVVPVISNWGFVVTDDTLRPTAKMEMRERNFWLQNTEGNAILQLWVDCSRRSIIIDGAFVTRENWSDISDPQPISANDIRLNGKFRLVRSYLYILKQGNLSYRIRSRNADDKHIVRLVEEFRRDLIYVNRYIFSGYRGRRIVEYN